MTDIKATMAELNGALDLVLQERDSLRDDLNRVRGAFNDNKNKRVAAEGKLTVVEGEREDLRAQLSRERANHELTKDERKDLAEQLDRVSRGKQAADLALTAQTANYEREKTDNALLRQLLEEAWRHDIGTRLKRDIKAALDSVPVDGDPGDRDEVASLRADLAEQNQGEPVAKMTLEQLLADLPGCYSKDDVAYGWYECVDNYHRADPAEVEQLRNELDGWKKRCQYNADTAHDVARERDTLLAQLTSAEGVIGAAMAIDSAAFRVGAKNIDVGMFRGLRVHLEQYVEHCNGLANGPAHEDPRDDLLRVCWRAMFGGEHANPLRDRMRPYAPVMFDEQQKP